VKFKKLFEGFGVKYLPGAVTQLSGKLTRKQAMELAHQSESLINLSHTSKNLSKLLSKTLGSLDLDSIFWSSSRVVQKLGKPNVIMPEFESSPGLWVLDDELTGIRWMIWSDGYKKNPWKGTKFEVIVPKAKIDELAGAFHRLIDHLK